MCIRDRFSGESALGKTVEIQGYPFTVVGVVTEKDSYDLVINSMDDYYMSVSYTHLDVYKRQSMSRQHRSVFPPRTIPALAHPPVAVSYTHLDVYKRQVWYQRHGTGLQR